ncbi:MAG: acyltransferase [Rhizobiales bacterium]|nr:acyltransferase [Hyphomicrobiales bacterium]
MRGDGVKDAEDGDPIALRSPFLYRQFERYLRWYVGRSFHGLRLAEDGKPDLAEGRPAIVCTNHPSWWDPLIIILAARFCFPDRIGYAPMEAAALESYRIFKRLGVFGVDLDQRQGARRFLHIGGRILDEPGAMLWVTAPGRFQDVRERPLRLQPGIAHLAKRHPGTLVLPLAIEYPFWNERYPEVLLRFGAPIDAGDFADEPTTVLLDHVEHGLAAAMDGLAELSQTRDPSRFETLLAGKVGIGGVYDLWRRAKAGLRGERFDAAHEPERR